MFSAEISSTFEKLCLKQIYGKKNLSLWSFHKNIWNQPKLISYILYGMTTHVRTSDSQCNKTKLMWILISVLVHHGFIIPSVCVTTSWLHAIWKHYPTKRWIKGQSNLWQRSTSLSYLYFSCNITISGVRYLQIHNKPYITSKINKVFFSSGYKWPRQGLKPTIVPWIVTESHFF